MQSLEYFCGRTCFGEGICGDDIREGKWRFRLPLSEVAMEEDSRTETGIEELDRVLGGGIVGGSLTLVGGDPGIGKSTLLLQVCQETGGKKQESSLYFRRRVSSAD